VTSRSPQKFKAEMKKEKKEKERLNSN